LRSADNRRRLSRTPRKKQKNSSDFSGPG
jgi:hypothetical protein